MASSKFRCGKSVQKDTILITIIYANNEIGTIQPIAEIGEVIKKSSRKTINSSTVKGGSPPLIFPYRCVPSGFVFGSVRKNLNMDAMTLNEVKFVVRKASVYYT